MLDAFVRYFSEIPLFLRSGAGEAIIVGLSIAAIIALTTLAIRNPKLYRVVFKRATVLLFLLSIVVTLPHVIIYFENGDSSFYGYVILSHFVPTVVFVLAVLYGMFLIQWIVRMLGLAQKN